MSAVIAFSKAPSVKISLGLQILPDHFHNPSATFVADANDCINCRDGRCAGQRSPTFPRWLSWSMRLPISCSVLGNARFHLPSRTIHSRLMLPARFSAPVFSDVAAAAEDLSVPIAAQHWTSRQINSRQIHAYGAHQQTGVVLSQPPISTAPSIGWLRSSSSVSIARKFRYIIGLGFM